MRTVEEAELVCRYIEGGFGETPALNERDWRRWRIVPRVLKDVREIDTAVTFLGVTISHPILVAPTLGQVFLVDGAERTIAEAAGEAGSLYALVSGASLPPAAVAGGAPYLQQVYLTADRSRQEQLVEDAVRAGAVGLLLTVDQPGVSGGAFRADAWKLFAAQAGAAADAARDPGFALARDITPDDVRRLAELSRLPVIVKGVLHPDDARATVQAGAAGVVVSNHGGRQLDGSLTPALALPEVADAIGGDALVLVDSGIRSGTDVFRALALGADAVMVGRPVLRAAAVGAGAGVVAKLRSLGEELESVMANAGTATLDSITRASVRYV